MLKETFMDKEAVLENTLRELVIANRILARENVIDDYGHVSVRSPVDPERFFISRSRSPEIVDIQDIMEFTLEGEPIDQRGRVMYSERVLHGAIFRARPDVNAVTHHHARAVLPFANTRMPLRPIFHMGSVIGQQVPVWDSQDEFGNTRMLIDDWPKAASLARTLGDGRTVMLRGHGAACVGSSLREAVFVSIYMKENAELVLQTLPLGEATYLTPEEVDMAAAMLLEPRILARSWDYRVARAGFRGL
jgi:ribulose-5-phosphate 4-epimerase/fuculose-1-phosphate aldolase